MENPSILRSFGRRKGRALRAGKQGLFETLLPTIQLSLEGIREETNPQCLIPNAQSLFLEIGFGGGEHLAHIAALHPDAGIIGCEPYINGIAGLLGQIEERALTNIRIYPDDARDLIAALPDACLARVFILYPDPWPKARHHKRRLVSAGLLDALARVMQPGAELRLATDHADYATWMLERLLSHTAFAWLAKEPEDWLNPPPEWIPTRYEQKGLAGRPTYLRFSRL